MARRLRVSVQSGQVDNMSKQQRRFHAALIDRLGRADLDIMPGSRTSATIDDRFEKIRQSHGVIILAFSQWEGRRVTRDDKERAIFPSEFTHMNAVMTVAAAKPVLVLREKSVDERGALRRGYIHPVVPMPNSLDVEWLESEKFNREFVAWLACQSPPAHFSGLLFAV